MNGLSAEPWVTTINSPSNKKTVIIGNIHQAFFSQSRPKICFTVLDFDMAFQAPLGRF